LKTRELNRLRSLIVSKPLVKPSNIISSNITEDGMQLDFDKGFGYSSFSIERNGVQIYKGKESSYIDYLLSPSTSYSYKVYGFKEDGVKEGNGVTYNHSTSSEYTTIYPETTNYMNELGVPNDTTLYWTGTAQQVTGSEVWNGFNKAIHFLKTHNVYSNMYLWFPMFGNNATMCSTEATKPTQFDIDFYGSWVYNSLGIKGNGSNTYGYIRKDNANWKYHLMPNSSKRGLGVVITGASNNNIEVEAGNARSINTRYFLSSNASSLGGYVLGLGEPYQGYSVTSSLGVSYGLTLDPSRVDGYKNGSLNHTYSSKTKAGEEFDFPFTIGALNEIGTIKYYSSKNIGSIFLTNGIIESLKGSATAKGVELFEKYIKRKTW
jgi:hypothetical protein